jgi:dTDP-4-amino-4,6-dideoxygalactose transaminase
LFGKLLHACFCRYSSEYLTIDETKIEAAITDKTTAILATHVWESIKAVEAIEVAQNTTSYL